MCFKKCHNDFTAMAHSKTYIGGCINNKSHSCDSNVFMGYPYTFL